MTSPNFLPSRTPQELEQDVRDIGEALDNRAKAYYSFLAFLSILRSASPYPYAALTLHIGGKQIPGLLRFRFDNEQHSDDNTGDIFSLN